MCLATIATVTNLEIAQTKLENRAPHKKISVQHLPTLTTNFCVSCLDGYLATEHF